MKQEQYQYTFRIEGSFKQYLETAENEEVARQKLTRWIFKNESKAMDQSEVDAFANTKLRLVYVR